MDTKPTNRKALGLVLLVFVLGIGLGVLGTYVVGGRVWGARPGVHTQTDRRARMVGQLTQELSLTPDQQKQLNTILADMQVKYAEIHKQIAPQTEQVRQEGRQRIRAILTPEQMPKYEDFLRRLDEERKKRNSP
jgi:Spy/CpxP family protein refolding chaperone